jgi:hypothetical protein
MDALRLRLASALEWGVAAAFLTATLAVVLLVLENMQAPAAMRAPSPAERTAAIAEMPASVPAGAVSVPVLPFGDGKAIRVGDTPATVLATVGRGGETGREEVDQGRLGQRLTRFYEYAGFRFIVVYEPFERKGAPRVSAIYLP